MEITLILFLFISGIFGISISYSIFKNHKENDFLNIYFILFILTLSLTQLAMSVNLFIQKKSPLCNFYFEARISTLILPIIFLYFKSLYTKKKKSTIIFHFVFPFFYFMILIYRDYSQNNSVHIILDKIIYFSLFLFTITYNYLCYITIYKNIGSLKKDITQTVKYKWIQFIFSVIIIITIIPLILYWSTEIRKETDLIYQLTSCTILLIACFKIISNPEILYGYNTLKNKVDKTLYINLKVDSLWVMLNNNCINNAQEIALKSKIEANLNDYIYKIESYILSPSFIIHSDLSIENMSHKLSIPKSHLNYLFKYHSSLTFIEFKKTIKIHYAMTLIQNDFLKSNTLNSLSKKVGFTSYDPFYRSFKKITKKTPLEYYNLIRSNK